MLVAGPADPHSAAFTHQLILAADSPITQFAGLLTSDMLLLRQLAATGLTMLLLPRWHRRHPAALCRPSGSAEASSGSGSTGASAAGEAGGAVGMDTDASAGSEAQLAQQAQQQQLDPAAVSAAAEALRAAVLADPGAFAAALFQQLAHGHPLLGAEGQQRSMR